MWAGGSTVASPDWPLSLSIKLKGNQLRPSGRPSLGQAQCSAISRKAAAPRHIPRPLSNSGTLDRDRIGGLVRWAPRCHVAAKCQYGALPTSKRISSSP
jgi:hypothetical protein